jgi:ankyrin repeat protein
MKSNPPADTTTSSVYSYLAQAPAARPNAQTNAQTNAQANANPQENTPPPAAPRLGNRSPTPNDHKRPRDEDDDGRGKAKLPRTSGPQDGQSEPGLSSASSAMSTSSVPTAQAVQFAQIPKLLYFYCGTAQEQGMQMITRADSHGIRSLLASPTAQLDKNALLIGALEAGNLEIAGLLLDAHANVHCCSVKSPMTVAVEKNNLPMLDFLIARGADVNEKDVAHNEMGLLARALDCGFMSLFEALLERGAMPEGVGLDSEAEEDENPTGEYTPLISAVEKGNLQALNVLLALGVPVNTTYGNEDALMKAARSGRLDMFTLLLQHGAGLNVDYFDQEAEDSMLTFAAEGGNLAICELVLEARRAAGVELLWQDELVACLKFAAQKGAADIVRLLVGVDFMPEIPAQHAQSLIESVARSGNLELFKYIEAKLTTLFPEWRPDMKVLFLCPMQAAIKSGNKELLQYVAQHYPDYKINEPNPDTQCTALMSATWLQNEPEKISLLIEFGADVNVQTGHGWRGQGMNALSLAVDHENEAAVVALLAAGATVVLPEDAAYWDPLAVAFDNCFIPYLHSLSVQSPIRELAQRWSFSQMLAADPRVAGQALVCIPSVSLSAKMQNIIKLLVECTPNAITRPLQLEQSRYDEFYVGPLSREQARPAPLMLAASSGNLDLVGFLLAKGAEVNTHTPGLPNATQYAIDHFDFRMLELLLQHGGRPNLPEPAGGWPPVVTDLLRHAHWLMSPTLTPQQLELAGIPVMSRIDLPDLANAMASEIASTMRDGAGDADANGVPQWVQKLEQAGVCRAITLHMAQKLRSLPQPQTDQQRQRILVSLIKELGEWVASWPPGSSTYDGPDRSDTAKARLEALVRVQVKYLTGLLRD